MKKSRGQSGDGARRTRSRSRRQNGRAMARLRYAYFAEAASPAGRYGIEFGDVLAHLWRARSGRGRIVLRNVRHLDDLVHAAACTLNVSPAWTDLVERYESILVRRCGERVGEMQTILLVRRMFSELRPERDDAPSGLETYTGDRPLRNWLSHRALGLLNRRQTAWFAADGETAAAGGPAVLTFHA